MWQIDKRFEFCYGHRVWTQNLNAKFCEGQTAHTKCRHLHGHEGAVHVYLESDKLRDGMVVDFNHLGWLKDFINRYIDHKFVIDIHDPNIDNIVGGNFGRTITGNPVLLMKRSRRRKVELTPLKEGGSDALGWVVSEKALEKEDTQTRELLEGFLFIDIVPTSENLAKWIYHVVDHKMRGFGVKTTKIEWFETPKSRSTYIS